MVTIAKYKRCSTELQNLDEQDATLEKEIQRIKNSDTNNNYEVLDFSDKAISGKNTDDRPQLQKMLKYVEQNKIDMVIFTNLDRLGRSLQDLLSITKIFEQHNVKFKSVMQNIDTSTSAGKLQFQILGAFAEFERNIIQERMREGRERAKLYGTKSGKPIHRPYANIDRDGVIYKYGKGISMNQIAKEYNVSITPIRRILKDNNIIN